MSLFLVLQEQNQIINTTSWLRVASKIVNHGYGVITGGGPGIMEAGNKGAYLAGGTIGWLKY